MTAPTAAPADTVDATIRAATLATLRQRGYAALSMEGVAADTGLAKTTLYRRYRNRADLATAALAGMAPIASVKSSDDSVRQTLEMFLRDFARRFEDVGLDVLGSMLVESDEELLELHRQRVVRPRVEQATALVREGQARGEVRLDAEPELVLEMMVGSFFALHIAGRKLSAPEWARQVMATLWDGLAPR